MFLNIKILLIFSILLCWPFLNKYFYDNRHFFQGSTMMIHFPCPVIPSSSFYLDSSNSVLFIQHLFILCRPSCLLCLFYTVLTVWQSVLYIQKLFILCRPCLLCLFYIVLTVWQSVLLIQHLFILCRLCLFFYLDCFYWLTLCLFHPTSFHFYRPTCLFFYNSFLPSVLIQSYFFLTLSYSFLLFLTLSYFLLKTFT